MESVPLECSESWENWIKLANGMFKTYIKWMWMEDITAQAQDLWCYTLSLWCFFFCSVCKLGVSVKVKKRRQKTAQCWSILLLETTELISLSLWCGIVGTCVKLTPYVNKWFHMTSMRTEHANLYHLYHFWNLKVLKRPFHQQIKDCNFSNFSCYAKRAHTLFSTTFLFRDLLHVFSTFC